MEATVSVNLTWFCEECSTHREIVIRLPFRDLADKLEASKDAVSYARFNVACPKCDREASLFA